MRRLQVFQSYRYRYDGESIDKGDYSTTTKEISLNVYQNNE